MTRLFSEHPAGIAVIDADGAIGWLNPGFAKLFAPRFGDLSGAEFITVLAALGATPAAVDAVRGLIDGSRHGLYEAAVAGPGGQARWLCFSAAPGAPEAAGTTLVCQDVTRYRDTAPRPGPWPPAKAPDEAGPFEPGKIEAADAIEEELRDPARILLAEDNRSNRLLALAILQNARLSRRLGRQRHRGPARPAAQHLRPGADGPPDARHGWPSGNRGNSRSRRPAQPGAHRRDYRPRHARRPRGLPRRRHGRLPGQALHRRCPCSTSPRAGCAGQCPGSRRRAAWYS